MRIYKEPFFFLLKNAACPQRAATTGKSINRPVQDAKAPLVNFWMPIAYEEATERDGKELVDKLEAAEPFKRDNSEIRGNYSILPPERWILLQKGESLILKRMSLFLKEAEAYKQAALFSPGSPMALFTLSRRAVTITDGGFDGRI